MSTEEQKQEVVVAPTTEVVVPTFYVTIGGTWSWADDDSQWWHPSSPLSAYLLLYRLFPLRPARPYKWSGRIAGYQFWRRLFGRKDTADHIDWRAAAVHLCDYLDHPDAPTAYEHRNILAHSHGGQVCFYAAAAGLKIRTLLTFGTPCRDDMTDIIKLARLNIGCWVHVFDEGDDPLNRRGQIGDGEWDLPWKAAQQFSLADRNQDVDGIGHSKVLCDPKHFHYFPEHGWVTILKTGSLAGLPPVP